MQVVGQPVDHRHRGVLGEIGDRPVGEGASHDEVDVARQHLRRVADDLPAPDLDVARGEEQGVPTELEHADLEAHPRAGRALLEDHGQGLAGERRPVGVGLRLHSHGEAQQVVHLVGRQVVNGEEMA
jgi:hypothetical protein